MPPKFRFFPGLYKVTPPRPVTHTQVPINARAVNHWAGQNLDCFLELSEVLCDFIRNSNSLARSVSDLAFKISYTTLIGNYQERGLQFRPQLPSPTRCFCQWSRGLLLKNQRWSKWYKILFKQFLNFQAIQFPSGLKPKQFITPMDHSSMVL